MIRIGFGIDTHRLIAGKKLYIGGVFIDAPFGADAHSDGDVLLHAICDALFGAAGLRDIGFHFPDTDHQYKNIDSKELLKKTSQIIAQSGFTIGNIDATVILQSPKLSPYIPQIQEVISKILNIPITAISIKAKTAENMGFVGRSQAIEAQTAVLIESAECRVQSVECRV
jgi:2-C-methyl-D-erythritol 2,4-cyclodiphosphate synthase